mmetsp:Transcript_26226/g.48808  ORF Transcript_26226/g.48808 Transcript_26226/m.48808 type:complete len:141 (-) Transcript_26226:445-867(-)|eukprot:CAMPEP_0197436504 /NCGR_PEP_ID=MMETSP1175-20131217/3944_1 /TAXON_ID=1003142 /ORGANISM="Triceratium dubium, Strain CCMP147" /LENGTH=140 /DNA_ID=CAMNT_0042965805 /DNA_START=188 /DNA_END=610 /DNA_ORIENTATION=+
MMMNHAISPLAFLLLLGVISSSDGFTLKRAHLSEGVRLSSSCLNMGGFLDGSQKKSDIMQREDDAMWIDEDDAGPSWNPFAPKPKKDAPAPAPAPAPAATKASTGGFPWQKKKAAAPPPPEPEPEKPKGGSGAFKLPWDK